MTCVTRGRLDKGNIGLLSHKAQAEYLGSETQLTATLCDIYRMTEVKGTVNQSNLLSFSLRPYISHSGRESHRIELYELVQDFTVGMLVLLSF